MKSLVAGIILFSGGVLVAENALADSQADANYGILDPAERAALAEWFTPEELTAALSVGTLSGSAIERVYDKDRTLSQLDWKFNNVPILQGSINWDFSPWVSLGASGWLTLGSHGASDLVDRDWLTPAQEHYSHISESPTRLHFASFWDVNATIWGVNNDDWRLGAMLGLQRTEYKWDARGGYFSYANGADEGKFPDQQVISYRLMFAMPYVGLTGGYRIRDFEMNAGFKYSPWVRAYDRDMHHLRDITFYDRNRDSDFYSVSADIGYYVTSRVKVYVEGEWMKVTNGRGDEVAVQNQGTVSASPDSSGIESKAYNVTAGLKYSF